MRVFQALVGEDLDADSLLSPALALAKYRVVVKRPSYAPPLANKKPTTSIKMKKNRFGGNLNGCSCNDILVCKPGKNKGELKYGCSKDTINDWTEQVNWAQQCVNT